MPPGPWDDEPDRVLWRDPRMPGLVLLARRGPYGAWCGYVGVPPGHPWHGADYADIPADAHGGITYAEHCDDDPIDGICHVPEPGEPDHMYWVGFDCGHYMDLSPTLLEHDLVLPDQTYKDLDYVKDQITDLAFQAHRAEKRPQ